MESVIPAALPVVHLEVRLPHGRPTVYEVGDGGFLIGTVPGCDLRLPAANLAPVLCLIIPHFHGASLRKLAPVQTLTVNGRPVTSTHLQHGDRVAVGGIEVIVSLTATDGQVASPPTGRTRRNMRNC
jgi:hypothetical protein